MSVSGRWAAAPSLKLVALGRAWSSGLVTTRTEENLKPREVNTLLEVKAYLWPFEMR